jgi:ABC-type polysaccharide/polyol phosphate transport system ATPase subunit
MRARLGFAVADCMRPDILLLDEVHEALDHEFRAVIEERSHALKQAGGIVVAAGHDHGLLERVCDRAVLMQDGRVVDDGPVDRVAGDYVAAL